MLKRLLNEFVLEFDLAIQGRLIVKEPEDETAKRKKKPDDPQIAKPVATMLPNGNRTIYIPGASLKGALRSQAERIARTLNEHSAGSCNPFAPLPNQDGSTPPNDLACSERISTRQKQTKDDSSSDQFSTVEQYKDVCPICRTFGHIGWGRRLRFTDCYPTAHAPDVAEMTHIGVDRVSGGVADGRTFTMGYATNGTLRGKLVLENFEMWQLGLLGFLWKDLADGLLPIGHKQTSGAGNVLPSVHKATLTQFGARQPENGLLLDVGNLFDEFASYGYQQRKVKAKFVQWAGPIDGLRWQADLTQPQLLAIWKAVEGQTASVLQSHQWPASMQAQQIAKMAQMAQNGGDA